MSQWFCPFDNVLTPCAYPSAPVRMFTWRARDYRSSSRAMLECGLPAGPRAGGAAALSLPDPGSQYPQDRRARRPTRAIAPTMSSTIRVVGPLSAGLLASNQLNPERDALVNVELESLHRTGSAA